MSESEDGQRRLRGTVEMTASGDVRWTIVRLIIWSFFVHRYHLTIFLLCFRCVLLVLVFF